MKTIDNEIRACFITSSEVNFQALRAVVPTATAIEDQGCFIRKPVEVQQLVKYLIVEQKS